MTCHKVFAYHGSNTTTCNVRIRSMRFYFELKLTFNYSLIFQKLTIKIILIVTSPRLYGFLWQ